MRIAKVIKGQEREANNLNEGSLGMKKFAMKYAKAPAEDGTEIYFSKGNGGSHLILESGSLDTLKERVRQALPEILEMTTGYKGEIDLSFEEVDKDY
ncbi:MAG: hypothetical protein FWE89_02275, partial [Syntrophaceae bacterium]|nr:hypothetical protein [Syntrophaceae bacterium]